MEQLIQMQSEPPPEKPAAAGPSGPVPAPAKTAVREYCGVQRRFQTGDVLLFAGTAWDSRVIRWATKSDYSHCGLVYVWNGPRRGRRKDPKDQSYEPRVYVLEARGKQGVRLVPMSLLVEDKHYERVDHLVGPLLTSEERNKMVLFTFPQLGKTYDYQGIFKFALFLIKLRLSRPPKDAAAWRLKLARSFNTALEVPKRRIDEQFFCSELLAAAFDHAGVAGELPFELVSPQDLLGLGPTNEKGEPFLVKMPPVKGG
jgi:hypothetical protein